MHLVRLDHPLSWGALDLPLLGITRDWHQEAISPPAAYSLALDPERLWFVASHGQPAHLHPKARPGQFLAGLWQYDVAELFIHDPATGRYLELNLAPNGAWWSAEFTAPRERATPEDQAWPGVQTHAELAPDGGWVAALTIPLDSLRERLNFGPSSTANVTFILQSPEQRFLTAAPLGEGEPNFHRPGSFPALQIHEGGLPGAQNPS